MRKNLIPIVLLMVFLLAACTPAATPTAAPTKAPAAATAAPAKSATDLILSTTSSTQDSGLLDTLLPLFEKQSGYKVKTVAVGSGAAMKMGEEGNADVLLVHAPASELEFMAKGAGVDRRLIMHNDFIIVGPKDDPAKIKGEKLAKDAFKKIADAKATFVSRADDSGTHKSELAFWKLVNITPKGNAWYLEAGQNMGATLKIASEKKGYTLTDRATYLATKATLELDVLSEGDPALLNVYHVITVNPEKFPKTNVAGAKAFADFLVSKDTQAVIGKFGVDKYGSPLFFGDAEKTDEQLGLPTK